MISVDSTSARELFGNPRRSLVVRVLGAAESCNQ